MSESGKVKVKSVRVAGLAAVLELGLRDAGLVGLPPGRRKIPVDFEPDLVTDVEELEDPSKGLAP